MSEHKSYLEIIRGKCEACNGKGRCVTCKELGDESGLQCYCSALIVPPPPAMVTEGAAAGRAEERARSPEGNRCRRCLPGLACCLLSDRKSVIRLQVGAGTLGALVLQD